MTAKMKELRQLNDKELDSKVDEMNKELMKLYSQVSTGTNPKKPKQIRELKRTIARILTINNEKKDGGSGKG
ncbi:50S ribosomal protein L29 [Nanoarchaeota archaeon]